MIRQLQIGLTGRQLAIVGLVFILTSIGAMLLAWYFRRNNRRLAPPITD